MSSKAEMSTVIMKNKENGEKNSGYKNHINKGKLGLSLKCPPIATSFTPQKISNFTENI